MEEDESDGVKDGIEEGSTLGEADRNTVDNLDG